MAIYRIQGHGLVTEVIRYDLWADGRGIGIIFLSFTVYDYLENVDYFFNEYYDVFHNKLNLGRVLDEYEKRNPDAIVDMPPSFFFEEFHKRFPDAKVSKSTLTTSILPQWILDLVDFYGDRQSVSKL